MRGAVKNYVFGQKWEPNTIIGGIGGTINTKSLLATKLGISESIVRNFEVVGSDVHCRITSDYNIPSSAFNADNNITKYIDLEAKVQQVGNLTFTASSVLNVYFPQAYLNVLALGDSATRMQLSQSDFGYEYVYLPNSIDGQALRGARIVKFTAPNLLILSGSVHQENSDLQEIDAPNLTDINNFACQNCSALTTINTTNVTRIGRRAFLGCSSMPSFNFPSLTEIYGSGVFYNASGATEVLMPLLENVITDNRSELFRNMSSCNLISMRKLKVLGDATVANTTTFVGLKTSCTIEVHEDMATSNAGNADATLQWVKDNRSATVEFYDNAGNYVSTL